MPAPHLPTAMEDSRYRDLCAVIGRYRSAAIAFSGGVDSTLLLKAAVDTLADRAVALFADTPLHPAAEAEEARATAAAVGARLRNLIANPLTWPEFVANPPDRCYHCKLRLYTLFEAILREEGCEVLLDGTNRDDLASDRPGLRALRQLEIVSPLAEAGLDKGDVREVSRRLGLPTWNKPSASCLATRIATDTPITVRKLQTVAAGEAYLRSLGFSECRMRLENGGACLELGAAEMAACLAPEIRKNILDYTTKIGLTRVLLNLRQRGETTPSRSGRAIEGD